MIGYEWVVEEWDDNENIINLNHSDDFASALRRFHELESEGIEVSIGLVRDRWTEADGVEDRQWAYLENGVLPIEFDGGAKVPQKFLKEVNG